MRIEAVVINASPLITLFRSGQADLLPRLFKRIVVPEAVWQEVTVDEREDRAARELGQQSWPIREHVLQLAARCRVESRGRRDGGVELCAGASALARRHR
jgi:predicted nucleic acid-binding protein